MTHSAAAAQHKAPKVLRVNLQDTFYSVDPAVAYEPVLWQLELATCAKLVNYPDKPWSAAQQPEPEIANGPPTVSADGKTYTFKLHADFRFSSPAKEEVTAQSFVRALERAIAPGANSPVMTFAQDIVGAAAFRAGQANSISGITATKKHELTIRLERPAADLLARLAMPFFAAVPLDAPPVDRDAVLPSAGPYYVQSFDREGTTVLRVNPNYHGKRPHLFEEIVYQANGRTRSRGGHRPRRRVGTGSRDSRPVRPGFPSGPPLGAGRPRQPRCDPGRRPAAVLPVR